MASTPSGRAASAGSRRAAGPRPVPGAAGTRAPAACSWHGPEGPLRADGGHGAVRDPGRGAQSHDPLARGTEWPRGQASPVGRSQGLPSGCGMGQQRLAGSALGGSWGGRSWTAQGLTPQQEPSIEPGRPRTSKPAVTRLQARCCGERGDDQSPKPHRKRTGKPEQRRPVGWEGRQAWQTRYSAPWEEQKLPLLARHQATRVMLRSWDSRPRPPRESCLPPASVSFPLGNGDSQVSQTGQSLEPEGQGPGCLCRKSPVAAPNALTGLSPCF